MIGSLVFIALTATSTPEFCFWFGKDIGSLESSQHTLAIIDHQKPFMPAATKQGLKVGAEACHVEDDPLIKKFLALPEH